MEKHLIKSYGTLLILTFLAFILQFIKVNPIGKISFIMFLFSIKFLFVAFQFMELKKANIAWKLIIITILILIVLPVILINI
ncbi:cytochrome C oxidase subunit IV family protein [Flavobacterium oreochromis]|uniref:Cytochrome C oxidase subunit IV n=2 Tax=Flavobacterium TaxID=237 RepID=A0A246GDX0_9FLAO|nr:cytochrome C oxidase subunit IV family protein [Flavobacterium oreochromis]OWP78375.1 hypothetical protein BWG23_02595 [Flavobacterium oreochromis]OWP78428.1 hypothetical protein BWK62_05125 [Flavobacterium oreochromis]